MAVKLGEMLLKSNLISQEQLEKALIQQQSNGEKLGYNLIKLGFVKEEDITSMLSQQYGVPAINLAKFEIDPSIIKLIPQETSRKYQIIPISRQGATLTTTESALFEWCEVAGTAEFKEISRLVRETLPAEADGA